MLVLEKGQHMRFVLSCLFFLLTLSRYLMAGDIPPGGIPVLPDDAALQMSLQGGGVAVRSVIRVGGMPFERAVQGQTLVTPARTSRRTVEPCREMPKNWSSIWRLARLSC